MSVEKRVFVGNIYNDHDTSLTELYRRFQRFGKCTSDKFESHAHFGYVNMEFENEAAFAKLKQSFNGVKFKGNILKVDVAKMGWQERWKKDQEEGQHIEEEKQKQMEKSQWEHYKKLENIKMSWIDRQQVIPGRMRQTPRKKAQLRNITFRINRDGELKVYKCYKNKLWGYERKKGPRDLVFKFTDRRYWRDGNDHIVDKLDFSRAASVWRTHTAAVDQNSASGEEDEEKDIEQDKVHDVLANVLEDLDFDKPMALEEEDDEDASSDYEYNALFNDKSSIKATASTKEKGSVKEKANVQQIGESVHEQPEDIEEEFIPTFGAEAPGSKATTGNKNTTEELRSLFDVDQPEPGFKLINESDDDIDEAKNIPEDDIPQKDSFSEPYASTEVSKHGSKGLFFPHFSSPFLHSQSQIAKLKTAKDPQELFQGWEEHFWEQRAAWTKEMKRKKRDATRQFNKKNSRSRGNGVIV